MHKSPLVSVIIPCYNHAPYLRERIDSVLNQDYQNFEVLILEDCSPDNSRDIINEYRGKERIREIVFNETNSGNTFVQWRKGISMANGELIWIAESDDVAEPMFLSKMVEKLVANPDAVLAFSHSTIIDAKGNELDNVWDCRSKYTNDGVYESRFFCLSRMLYYNAPYNASMVVFRKKYYFNLTDEYLKYRHNGDYCFWIMMCKQGKVVEVPEKLNRFRQHDRKVSASGHDEAFLENAEIVDFAIDHYDLSAYQKMCLKGKYRKRWLKAKESTKHEAKEKYPRVYGGTFVDTLVYTFGKFLSCIV